MGVAVALANRLERESIPVKIKWPNDLFVRGKKLAGFLPRVVYRGKNPILLCIGVGMNICNRVPKEGISLAMITGKTNISISYWSYEVLLAIEKAILLLENPIYLDETDLLYFTASAADDLSYFVSYELLDDA